MFEILFKIVLIYLYLFLTGIGLYFFITPDFLKKDYFKPVLPLFYSILLLSMIGLYGFILSINIKFIFWISIILGTLLVLIAYKHKKQEFLEFFIKIKDLFIRKKLYFLILLITICTLLLPIIKTGISTTTWRVGIDQVMYTEDTQFLLDGGTLHELKTKLISPSNMALRHDIFVNKLNLIISVRYGAAVVFAVLGYLTSSVYAYQIINVLLIINYLLIGALVFYLLKETFNLSNKASFGGAVVLLFNCNLLNIYYEGGMAQIFAMPFIILALLLFMKLRELYIENITKIDIFKIIGLLSVILAMLIFTYNESLVTLIAFIIFTNIFDLFIYRKLKMKSNIIFFIAALLSLIIVLPIIPQFLLRLSDFIENLKMSGFYQPHWAMLSEILGCFNIYNPDSFYKCLQQGLSLVPRNLTNFLMVSLTSIFFIIMYFKNIFKNKIDKAFWLTPIFLIFASFMNSGINHLKNYSYMKIYTILVPLLFIVFYSSFFLSNKGKSFRIQNLFNKISISIITLLIISTGFSYLTFYSDSSRYISKDMYELFDFVRNKNYKDKVFLFQPRGVGISRSEILDGLFEHFCIASMNIYWVDHKSIQQSQTKYIQMPVIGKELTTYLNYNQRLNCIVYLIIDKKNSNCPECIKNRNINHIVYENNEVMIIDTEKKLAESLTNKDQGIFDFNLYWNML